MPSAVIALCNESRTFGWLSRNLATIDGSRYKMVVELAAIRSSPASSPLTLSRKRSASPSRFSTSGWAISYSSCPSRLGIRRRPARSNNTTPNSRSSACSCRVTAGWLMKSASAARDTEPRRTVWQNARSGLRRSDL